LNNIHLIKQSKRNKKKIIHGNNRLETDKETLFNVLREIGRSSTEEEDSALVQKRNFQIFFIQNKCNNVYNFKETLRNREEGVDHDSIEKTKKHDDRFDLKSLENLQTSVLC